MLDLHGHRVTENYCSVLPDHDDNVGTTGQNNTSSIVYVHTHTHTLAKMQIQCESLRLAACAGIASMPFFLGMLIAGRAVHPFCLHAPWCAQTVACH